MTQQQPGHAFLSYVREDSADVDRLEKLLGSAGISVWRDKTNIWAGDDWKREIRRAIQENALAFVGCFSKASAARAKSGQNEEVLLAIDEIRARNPAIPWFFSVLLDDEAEVPDLEIGGGRMLRDLQWVKLSGPNWDMEQVARLLGGIGRVLGQTAPVPAAAAPLESQLKAALRNPGGDIALRDLVMPVADAARSALSDEERFPIESDVLAGPASRSALFIADLAEDYMAVLQPVLEALVTVCSWAREMHYRSLSRFVERALPELAVTSGKVVLIELRGFPRAVVSYAGTLAALAEENYGALRAAVIDAQIRDAQDGQLPLVARCHPYLPFQRFDLSQEVLARRASGDDVSVETLDALQARGGKRRTPMSDFLHDRLRPLFRDLVPDDEEYSRLFDRLEVFLSLLADDQRAQFEGKFVYINGPIYGRYTWRRDFGRATPNDAIASELEAERDAWPPLRAGLFGGSVERATNSLAQFRESLAEVMRRGPF
jgi:hypothetical protein